MTFDEVLAQVQALLQQEKRVSYRALKLRFSIDDDYIEGLKDELIHAKRVAVDEESRVLVWVGASPVQSSEFKVQSSPQSPAPQTPNPELRTSQSPAGERRQLTVMFIDLVGSTMLSQQLDPEDYHARVRAYQTACHQVIARYEGHVAQYLGDGILVYFGYPLAHEDDAARAVRAGLEIITAIAKQVPSPRQGEGQGEVRLQIRIGIHTGLVVVGEIGSGERRENLALGETPNLAARIQGMAEPNALVISAATRRLVQGVFEYQELGSQALKGVTAPLTLYHVVQESAAQSRFEAATQAGLTPLVGREYEIAMLLERWQLAQDGEGQVVLLSGEPGIGKSRILSALWERLEGQGAQALRFQCSPYHVNSAFHPIIDNFERVLQFGRDETPESKLDKLEALVVSHYGRPQQDVRFFATMLSIPCEERYGPLVMTPQKHKDETLRSLVDLTTAAATTQPTVLLFEDAHWADPTSLEVLDLLIDRVRTTPLLIVLTHRPEFQSRWSRHGYVTALNLSKLTRAQSSAIIAKLTGDKALPTELLGQILAKTDGVPLFVEELTKTVLESIESKESSELPHRTPLQLAIPATLQDALMARLDRLGVAKEIAQIGAAIGREFSYALLAAVVAKTTTGLDKALDQLTESGLAFRRGTPPEATYTFKHALVQDAAYDSLLKSRRHELHATIARVLMANFPQTTATEPELLAHHLTAAGQGAAALPYWQQAGTLALKRLALKEAIAHLNQGMEILGTLPPSPERDGKELDLRTPLGTAWIARKGFAAPEVWTSLHPALGLAKSLSRREAVLPIYNGLWNSVLVQGRIAASRDWVNEMLATAEASGDPDLLLVAHTAACVTHYERGDLTQSRTHGDRVMALYDEEQHRHLADLMNRDPKTSVGIFVSFGTWMRGYPDRAVQVSEANEAHARRRGHPFDLGFALTLGSQIWGFRCEPEQMLARVEEAERLGRAHRLPFISDVLAQVWKGVAWLRTGRLAEGIPKLREAMETFNAHGVEIGMPYFRAVLAEGLALSGDSEGGLRLIEESLTQIARPGWEERSHLAEVLRLKGEILLMQESTEQRAGSREQKSENPKPNYQLLNPQSQTEAEECFLQAIEVAQEQHAKSWELRASTSLARLWQSQGKKAEAHRMLSEVYTWFTEGFDTKDLQEARAMLEELES